MKPRDLRPWRDGAFDPQSLPPTLRLLTAFPGQQPTADQIGAVKKLYAAFRDSVRTSVVNTMSRRDVLPDGTEVSMRHEFGRDHLTVKLPPTGRPEVTPFYGGLVLRFERLTPAGEAYLTDHAQGDFPEPEQRETIPLAQDWPRRVPGTLGEGTTEWLVLQIAGSGDLADNPVRNGLIKLFRIANPLIGNIASHNYGNRRGYILTADWSVSGSDYRASAFYLCGRNTGIPPSPVSAQAYNTDMVRMYTFGFNVRDFARPGQMVGTIVLVWWGRLWLYRPATGWEQVTETAVSPGDVTNGLLQPFGYDFSLERVGSEAVLRCTGTNEEGACSEFELRIGTSSVSGTVTLRPRTQYLSPGLPVTTPTTITGSWTNTLDDIAPVHVPGAPGFNETYVFTDGCFKASSVTIADSASFSSGSAAQRDHFRGGVLWPAQQGRYYELTASRTTDQTNVAEYVHSYVTDGLGNNVALPHFGFDQPYSATATLTLFNTTLGNITFNFSSASAGALDTSVVNGTIGGPVGIVQSLYEDRTWVSTFPLSGSVTHTVVREYSAFDNHRKSLAWRHDATRVATWSADLDGSNRADGFISGTVSAASYAARLVDRGLNPVAERADFLQSFNGVVTYAGAFSFSDVPAFCAVPTVTNDVPSRPQGVSSFVPLFNTKIDGGTIAAPPASLVNAFWFRDYLAHFNDLGSEHTIEVVPDGSGPPGHSNVFAPDEGTWNVALNAASLPTFNLAGYESMSPNGAIEVIPVPGFDWPSTPSTTLTMVTTLDQPADLGSYYQAPSAQRPHVELVDDRVYVDPRTDGYVAQSFWDAEMESSGDCHASIETLVGNRDSFTTLDAVLTEAAQLEGLPDDAYTRVFIRQEAAKDVAVM